LQHKENKKKCLKNVLRILKNNPENKKSYVRRKVTKRSKKRTRTKTRRRRRKSKSTKMI